MGDMPDAAGRGDARKFAKHKKTLFLYRKKIKKDPLTYNIYCSTIFIVRRETE